MDDWVWIVLGVIVVVGIVGALAFFSARRRSNLKDRFGPEYDRTAEREGSSRGAVKELKGREQRREELDIRPLNPISLERYRQGWNDAQARFVDHPDVALKEADELVVAVMRERGYPVDDFEQQAADVSVDHPHVVENYRGAHSISQKTEVGEASTEEKRQGMVYYRALFEELLETDEGSTSQDGQVGSSVNPTTRT
jgi:hypothetical protein